MTFPPDQEPGEVPDPDFPPPPPVTVGSVLYDTLPTLLSLVPDQRYGHIAFTYFDPSTGAPTSVNVQYGTNPVSEMPPDDEMPPDA